MANEKNLVPIGNRTTSEAREIGRKGGKASGEARRRKADFKKTLNILLTSEVDDPETKLMLEKIGLDCTLESGVNAALIKRALKGDVAAYNSIAKYSGQVGISDLSEIEQLAKVDKLRAEEAKLKHEVETPEPEEIIYTGIPANTIAPAFAPVVFDIQDQAYTEYVFPGGRGSAKSSFVSLQIIDRLMEHPEIHAVVMRQVGDTLRGSVYQQIQWAVEALGLEDDFHATVSPMEITRKSTGQKIFFRGADDPGKLKSIKVPFGYIGVLWFEELDQFQGPEAVRKIEQSVIRGGDIAYNFKSFNPPKSAINWANKYIKMPKATRLVTESNYLQVPKKWLGKPFLDEADFLKEVNPTAYENEYLGVANGTGGNVFDNVVVREITDEEIASFDRVMNGVDWGWYPDPFAFVRCQYNPAQGQLLIFDEFGANKMSNAETAEELKRNHGITASDVITCDSAEPKSVEDYRNNGLFAQKAKKGPESRKYSFKWLQSLREIIIDSARSPKTAEEFLNYEYERDKEGEVISGYPDGNDHFIDAVRYACEKLIRGSNYSFD